MIVLFKLIFITSILVLGWKIVTYEGMALHAVSLWVDSKIEEGYKIFNLLICPFCMPTLFSLFGYGFSFVCGIVHISVKILLMYPLVICGASILSGGAWSLFTLILKKIEYYDNMPVEDPNFEEDIDTKEPNESYFKRN